ncbi:pseudaminic acid cytidylyltransferase [Motiliproteus coralliicola]|uniref:Pseudaminic acid cytidylyltransferase n=1 Tax=Motiliproteus coralliicola TaxID=2283196 RepID=A0A369WM70_9GAMM|nr:pseudaminic acid cytidylyltransferase [Motiliproteus coralliicola]RDE22571.1 pseudaminic acid cytidylyltransferase [Motiliproteus coralliicola]
MRVAVIPARGGSKRIPRKNIKEFCGKPMIAWSIEAAKASGCFDRIIVSTDDDEIAEVAQAWGAEVPFVRPKELSDDFTGTIPVIKHAVEWLDSQGYKAEDICCIYATAPFIRSEDLSRGLESLQNESCDYAFSVTSFPFPIQRAIKIDVQGRVRMFQPEHFMTRSQDLEEAYHDAGQFYWGRREAWLGEKTFFQPGTVPVLLPRHRVQDIDTLEDWTCAELLFELIKNQEVEQ